MFLRFLTIDQSLIISASIIGVYILVESISAICTYKLGKSGTHSFSKKAYHHLQNRMETYFVILTIISLFVVWLGYMAAIIIASLFFVLVIVKHVSHNDTKDFSVIFDIVKNNKCDVGDYIKVGNLSGKVVKFNYRGIEAQNASGEYIYFAGSKIDNLINNSKSIFDVNIDIVIPIEKDVEKLKALLEKGLPLLINDYPMILEGPNFDGISYIDASTYSLSLSTKLKYEDIDKVSKAIKMEVLKLIGKKHE